MFPSASVFLLVSLATSVAALSPPWWILHQRLTHALGYDPSWIEVGSLNENGDANYTIEIVVNETASVDTAQSLATLLNRTGPFQFGGVTLDLLVYDGFGQYYPPQPFPVDPGQARLIVEHAFANHPLVADIKPYRQQQSMRRVTPVFFFVEFEPVVIQLYTDNLKDPYGNLNEAAQDSFASILQINSPDSAPPACFSLTTKRF